MLYSNELFQKAKEEIDARRQKAEEQNAERMRSFEALEPRYRTLKLTMIDSVREALTSVSMDRGSAEKKLIEQRDRNLQAQQEIKALLRAHDLPDDYLETRYTCPVCGDTGCVGIELCACFSEVLQRLAFEEANRNSPLKFSSFDDFRLDYYSDRTDPAYGCSPKERMAEILEFCKQYVADFDLHSESLYMCGETGLGKTHLSLAIAGEVIKKGYHVLYNSAQNIFNELQKEYFGKGDGRGQFESLVLACDLLIMDDLGAEFSTQFTTAALYNIINTRINQRLPTIINTNLSNRQLEERYDRRISSRLIGEFAALRFFGGDVRQQKKYETN